MVREKNECNEAQTTTTRVEAGLSRDTGVRVRDEMEGAEARGGRKE